MKFGTVQASQSRNAIATSADGRYTLLRCGGQGLGDRIGQFETAAGQTGGGLIAVGADDEAGGAEVDGPEPFLHGRPIDNDFDMGTYREWTAAAKPDACGTEIAGGTRAPARGSTTLGNTEMNWHADTVALTGAPVLGR